MTFVSYRIPYLLPPPRSKSVQLTLPPTGGLSRACRRTPPVPIRRQLTCHTKFIEIGMPRSCVSNRVVGTRQSSRQLTTFSQQRQHQAVQCGTEQFVALPLFFAMECDKRKQIPTGSCAQLYGLRVWPGPIPTWIELTTMMAAACTWSSA